MGNLENKKVMVIGASGGIGAACANKCLEEGAQVLGSFRKHSPRIGELKERGKDSFLSFELDLSDSAAAEEKIRRAAIEFGGLDAMIYAAGISRPKLLFTASIQEFEEVLTANLTGFFSAVKGTALPLAVRHGGSVVCVSSVFGLRGGTGQAAYCASKAGMLGIVRTAALELAKKNIRVNAVAPGYVETEMTAGFSENLREKCLGEIPLGRFGSPQEVAELCVFLAGSRSQYITGQTFVIDGGLSI